jgi:hypothetical protein
MNEKDIGMELSLDPQVTALVLIDLQRGIVGRQLAPYAAADVVRNRVKLADALRAKGGLVIFVRVNVTETLNLPVDAPTPRVREYSAGGIGTGAGATCAGRRCGSDEAEVGRILWDGSGAATAAATDRHDCDGRDCDEPRSGVDGAGGARSRV